MGALRLKINVLPSTEYMEAILLLTGWRRSSRHYWIKPTDASYAFRRGLLSAYQHELLRQDAAPPLYGPQQDQQE